MYRVHRDTLVQFLDARDLAGGKHAVYIARDDKRVDWSSLCTAGFSAETAAISVGQDWSRRCVLPGGRALHLEGKRNVVVMHIDAHDPGVRPIPHVVAETQAIPGALVGVFPWLLGVASGPLALALVVGGAVIGGHQAPAMTVWGLERVDWRGPLFRRLDGWTPQRLFAAT